MFKNSKVMHSLILVPYVFAKDFSHFCLWILPNRSL